MAEDAMRGQALCARGSETRPNAGLAAAATPSDDQIGMAPGRSAVAMSWRHPTGKTGIYFVREMKNTPLTIAIALIAIVATFFVWALLNAV
jgi:hypothetical protein